VKSPFAEGFKEQTKPISLRNEILWTLLLGVTEGKLSDHPRSLQALFSVILHPRATSAKTSGKKSFSLRWYYPNARLVRVCSY